MHGTTQLDEKKLSSGGRLEIVVVAVLSGRGGRNKDGEASEECGKRKSKAKANDKEKQHRNQSAPEKRQSEEKKAEKEKRTQKRVSH